MRHVQLFSMGAKLKQVDKSDQMKEDFIMQMTKFENHEDRPFSKTRGENRIPEIAPLPVSFPLPNSSDQFVKSHMTEFVKF